MGNRKSNLAANCGPQRGYVWVRRGRKVILASTALITAGNSASGFSAPADANYDEIPGVHGPVEKSTPSIPHSFDSDSDKDRAAQVRKEQDAKRVEEAAEKQAAEKEAQLKQEAKDKEEAKAQTAVGYHTYDEVGTNVLVEGAHIDGTDGDDTIVVTDNKYHREVSVNGNTYIAPHQPGEGISISGGDGNDTITGTEFDDTISGWDGDDVINGKGGNDKLDGGEGNDTISGGSGNDLLFGHVGDDTLEGGSGHDRLFGDDGNDRIIGGSGNDHLMGMKGDDYLSGGNGADKVSGGEGDDVVVGGRGSDILYGGDGNDKLVGKSGNDYLSGGGGDDKLFGGFGRDVLGGGFGDDVLKGGWGHDTAIGGPGEDKVTGSWFVADKIFADSDDAVRKGFNDQLLIVEPDLEMIEQFWNSEELNAFDDAETYNSDLTTFASIPTGQRLLRKVDANDREVTARAIHYSNRSAAATVFDDDHSDAYLRPDGTPGPGVDVELQFATGYEHKGDQPNNPLVTMGHEFIHADHANNGLYDPGFSTELDKEGNALSRSGETVYTPDLELQAMGLPYDKDGNQETDPLAHKTDDVKPQFSGPDELESNTEPITHRMFEEELGLPLSSNYNHHNVESSRHISFEPPNHSDHHDDGSHVYATNEFTTDESSASDSIPAKPGASDKTISVQADGKNGQEPEPESNSVCVDEGSDDRLNWGVNPETNAGCWVNGTPTKSDCVDHGESWECPDGLEHNFD